MMSDERPDVLIKATEIVQRASTEGIAQLSPADVATLVSAVVQDIVHADENDEKRLAKVETQTRVLAEAVIALGEPARTLTPAIAAVKAKM
jgi:hypothetical protein